MTTGDDDWLEFPGNLRKARKSWVGLTRILIWEGENPNISGFFFKAVIQVLLLFRAETWDVTPQMERDLSIFQHMVARRITRSQTSQMGEGRW